LSQGTRPFIVDICYELGLINLTLGRYKLIICTYPYSKQKAKGPCILWKFVSFILTEKVCSLLTSNNITNALNNRRSWRVRREQERDFATIRCNIDKISIAGKICVNFFSFFFIRGNLTFPESVFCGPRWGSKTPAVPGSYKRCTPWLELKSRVSVNWIKTPYHW